MNPVHRNDIIGFVCILFLTPLFMLWFGDYKPTNPYIRKLITIGLPVSLSFITRKMIINVSS